MMVPFIVAAKSSLSIDRQCKLLSIARSNYYYHLSKPLVLPDEAEITLRHRIQKLCLKWPSYGYRRITHQLQDEGCPINHKRVKRLMKEDNLLCLRRKPFVPATTDSRHGHRVYPNLAKGLILTEPNQLWIADITYIRLHREFVYLAVILDGFSRRLIGWALHRSINTQLTLEALQMALRSRPEIARGKGLIHHSDRGVQYASGEYTAGLAHANICISMSRKGNPYDNAKAESFMSTLKKEEIHMNEYASFDEVKSNLHRFLHEYNEHRLHSSIGYCAPTVFENHHKLSHYASTLSTAFSVQE